MDIIVPVFKITFLSYIIYKLGFIWGVILFFVCYFGLIKLTEILLQLEQISVFDSLFFMEYKGSPNVIQTAVIIEKLDYASFKRLISQRGIQKYKRLRQKVERYFNEMFWKEIPIEDAEDNIMLIPSEIKTLSSVMSFIEYEFPKALALSKPQWEVYYKENYNETQSLFVFKYHHSLGDGLSLLNLFSGICDNLDLSEFNTRAEHVSWPKKICLALLSPYFVYLTLPQVKKEDVNALQRFGGKISGEKKIVMSKPFEFEELRRIYKKYDNCTFNDLAWAIIAKSIDKYSTTSLNQKMDTVIGAMGVSFRTEIIPYELGNCSAGSMVRACVKEELSEGIRSVRDVLKPLKNKTTMLGASYLLGLISRLFLNDSLLKKAGETSFEKVAFIYTNVNGPPTKNLTIGERKVIEIFPFVPQGNLSFSIITFTYGGQVRFSLTTDAVNGPDTAQILANIESEIDLLVKSK